ncbi:YcxB family protein [Streptomyces sp. NPDC046203]|uniref:YcxB family protein n=1 Tax=Streptomyces sp. NPDC046203 TaxID=3154602 RepID=UPI0033C0B99C
MEPADRPATRGQGQGQGQDEGQGRQDEAQAQEQDQGQGQTQGSVLELTYLPTRADVLDAVRVQMRYGSFRRVRWLIPFTPVMAALGVLVEFGAGDADPVRVALLVGLGLFVPVFGKSVARLTAWQMYGLIGRQGEFRARVDGDGVRWVTRESEIANRWPMLPRYQETDTQFVLLTADKARVGVAALPKRGVAAPADVDRLRALLDRHATRL